MKQISFLNMILLSTFGTCFSQVHIITNINISVNEVDKQRAEECDIRHFFICMTSNEYNEKIAKNNYYIFNNTVGEYLYYGKVHTGFSKFKITEIFKVNIDILKKQLPNFRKLHGYVLKNIVISDILRKNGISNQSQIIIKNISYQLDDVIIVSIDFVIREQEQHKIYKLNTINFSIIK